MNDDKIKVSKDDVEVVDGKIVIKNEKVLEAIQSEQGVNLNSPEGQDAVSVGIVVTF
ncbi:MAG: hypothetical protein IJ535_07305 [Pseudobutyrivibrio sp.]|uniref:hypothetical protein n=1 Tax=Pseudobutyrivibrio sp. TaxID=2014367 RepID=UPI0025D04D35|nr:hypothetical protein [Pseudobutyrivibrio sp.]MBQ8489575.1 hypothetical protein [Pseudobutyrivibrio sp.]